MLVTSRNGRRQVGAAAAQIKPELFDSIAANLVRAVRGRRSQTNFSRLIGYRSNIARRWEVGACWPAASAFLCAAERARTFQLGYSK